MGLFFLGGGLSYLCPKNILTTPDSPHPIIIVKIRDLGQFVSLDRMNSAFCLINTTIFSFLVAGFSRKIMVLPDSGDCSLQPTQLVFLWLKHGVCQNVEGKVQILWGSAAPVAMYLNVRQGVMFMCCQRAVIDFLLMTVAV